VARHLARRGKSSQGLESRVPWSMPLLTDRDDLTTIRRPRGDGIDLR
jgi:hypothetical protein